MRALADLAQRCGFAQMEYGFLYNPTTNLLAIGYNVSERRLDASYYDLLASKCWPASSPSPRASCRRSTGSHWVASCASSPAAGAAVVERLDVRVPDAAAGDAQLSEHAAGPDLPVGDRCADRLWQAPQRAVGISNPATTRSTPA
jgi:hypothetical protein